MHLLIALDNSPLNERITEFLKGFLPQLNGMPSFSFIHVISNDFIGAEMGYSDITMNYDVANRALENDAVLISELRKDGQRVAEETQKQLNVTGTMDFPLGDPVSVLAEACEQKKPDFLVIGTHSRKGINHFLFGNFAEKMLRHVNVPLIIIPENTKHVTNS
jgi:nucleotide-binding universal stress UspA family protein